jgi:hypothetical protein
LSGIDDTPRNRIRLYAYWGGLAGIVFFAVYPTLNWFTSTRAHRLHLYVAPELAIPLVPQFIWPYLSMYPLLLAPLFLLPASRMPALGRQLIAGTIAAGLIFLVLPADLGFIRVVPSDPMYAKIFAGLFGLDRPHNLVPSLHVVWSCAIILACTDVARPITRGLLYAWLAIVIVSTVLVHQHHVMDAVAALALVFILRRRYGVPNA